jgi:hypothetical protein
MICARKLSHRHKAIHLESLPVFTIIGFHSRPISNVGQGTFLYNSHAGGNQDLAWESIACHRCHILGFHPDFESEMTPRCGRMEALLRSSFPTRNVMMYVPQEHIGSEFPANHRVYIYIYM